ncbi:MULTISPECIES: TatD family hydrolase [Campylobacter]|uniref:TatD family hydrolase n=1 Tax=Campylobacter porcelli TaxID=1660073 RepID=A0ABU7M4S5_9BACT|nr:MULTISPECIES: TatD family hydrolase [unclassified Campylobacter]MCR8678926.1 TatD family hydrolase [Campylobacter sp. RM19072]MCR8696155.1 TatD family hydrolase [Campylobacter sp. RM19073]MEE3744425.1 TatD family hydrolase [Campylobacter sp. CX2-4855-23]
MIIDTHCHLDDARYDDDISSVIKNAFDNKVGKIIIPGADIKDLPKAAKIANSYENIYFAAGVHPYEIDGYDESVIYEFAKDKKCVAIGECGLDYFRLPEVDVEQYKARQKDIFITQIKLAIELKLPLIVHIRDANEDSLKILKEYENELVGGVLHCFNASPILLELSSKFYYGIGGVLTFKNGKKLTQILPKIPLNRLLIETDAPYLTPEPYRGKRNEPAFTTFVADKMAEILSMNKDEIVDLTTQNASRLFGI